MRLVMSLFLSKMNDNIYFLSMKVIIDKVFWRIIMNSYRARSLQKIY